MRKVENLIIDEVIIHILDPGRRKGGEDNTNPFGTSDGFVPSQTSLPLEQESLLADYFKNHIQASLKNPGAIAARFREINPGEPSGLVASIFDGSGGFVDTSREIARKLYSIIKSDRRTKPCAFTVIRYRAENYHGAPFLAILKIDPSQIFRHEVVRSDNGQEYVSFILQATAFTRERLQKAAFIQALNPRHQSYDMILLDTQVRDTSRQDVADYFKLAFLDTVDAFDPYTRTKRLYGALIDAKVMLKSELTDSERQALDTQIMALFTLQRVNIDDFIGNLPIDDEKKRIIYQVIDEALPDREFPIDPAFGRELISRRRFTGDYGLRLSVDALHYEHVIKSIDENAKDSSGNRITRIVIESETWREAKG